MAISTYNELKTAIGSWLHRSDLTAQYANFIILAESRLTRQLQPRESEVETSLTATPASRYIALPSGFKRPVALWLTDSTPRLLLTKRRPEEIEYAGSTGLPLCWAIDGANIALDVLAQSAFTLTLRYQAAFALSDTTTTNYVLTQYPDVYLFGALAEGARYIKDTNAIGLYETMFARALKEAADTESDVSDTPLLTEFGSVTLNNRSDITRGY